MKNTLSALLLISAFTFAQTGSPAVALPTAPVAPTTTASATTSFLYLEASYDAYNTPHVTGSIDYDKQVAGTAATGHPTFATSEISFQPLGSPKGAVMTVVQVGVAQGIMHLGRLTVIGVASTGVAVSSLSSTGSFSGGGGFVYKLPKTVLGFDHIKVLALSEKTGPTGNLGKYYIGFGRGF
jgi:hypothetical protein